MLPRHFARGGRKFTSMLIGGKDSGSGPALFVHSLPLLVTGLQDAADACWGRVPRHAAPVTEICGAGVVGAVAYRVEKSNCGQLFHLWCVWDAHARVRACVWYLRFWTADLHDSGFWSDRKPPAPLELILTFQEFLLKMWRANTLQSYFEFIQIMLFFVHLLPIPQYSFENQSG